MSVERNIEAIYPLSPIQEGMLFHTLADEPGIYLVQLTCVLRGPLDREVFRHVWQSVYDRHSALRTSFQWEGLEKAVQVVLRRVSLRWDERDWHALPEAEQRRQARELLAAGRRSGLDLTRPPLTRLLLARLADDAWLFAWEVTHLVVDGWSLPLLLREVFSLYAGLCRCEPVHLQESRPYRDYVLWLLDQDLAPAELFWRRLLAGFSAPTPLPVDRLATPGRSGRAEDALGYRERIVELEPAAVERLLALCRRYQLTVNTIVQGAWALLLACYSGERDVVFGSTVSGRSVPLAGIESMIGLFINTLPVRVAVKGSALLLPWLRRIQSQQAEMRQHEFTPLVKVQGWSDIPRGAPLFDSILVSENFPVDPATKRAVGSAAALTIEEVRSLARTNYALTVLARLGERLALHIKYDPDRFEESTVGRALGHLQTLLLAMAGGPLARLAELSPLSAAERHQLLREQNDTRADRPRGRTLDSLFAARVALAPAAPALVAGEVELTYAELDREVKRLTAHLRRLGIGPGCSVGVYLGRCWQMVPALLAVLRAGAAYLPLETSYPPARVQWLLAEMAVPCVITQRSQLGLLDELRAQLPRLGHVFTVESWAALPPPPAAPSPSPAGPQDLAYTIFTSGSTGTPKGVQVLHRAAVHIVEWVNETFAVGPEDRILFVTSLCFDLSVYDVFGLLAAGGSIRLGLEEELLDPARLVTALCAEPITFWDTAPAFLQQLVPLWEGMPVPAATCLRLVFLSGDWVPLGLPAQVRSVFRGARVVALGGATEATVWSNFFPVAEVAPHWVSIPYGRPIWNSRYYVLDARLEPCPIGVPGDLFIAGECLASGYAAEAALTAEKFLPDVLGEEHGARMYRTGDRARFLLDGNLEFLGRRDQQVKIRGFRIELGEIESVLGGHPGVSAAVAVVREDAPGRRRLVGYYVPAVADPAPGAEELRRFLAARLPDYMVPATLVALASLPVTANGKLDRRALPDPDRLPARQEHPPSAPVTETEHILARIWSELLRVEQIGIDDDFFALGGDSILSIQIVSRAAREGIRLQPRQVFEHPTIAELAAAARWEGAAAAAKTATRTGAVPLIPAQHWLLAQELADPHHFNQALLLEIGVPLATAPLAAAFTAVAEHHDAFRLRFRHDVGGWRQEATGKAGAELLAVDLAGLPPPRRAGALRATADAVQAGFDLATGPLLRAVLFALGAGEPARLLLVAHHLVIDAVSWRIVLEDIETAYRDLVAGRRVELPRSTPFQHWAARLAEHAAGPAVAGELGYWLAAERAAVPALPVDHPGGRNGADAVATAMVALPPAETRALLQEVPEVYRTRLDEVLLAALAWAVTDWSGAERVLVDVERHGREEIFAGVDLTRTVGWFTAFVPLLLEMRPAADPGTRLRAVKERVRGVPDHGLGHGLLRYLGPDAETRERLRAQPPAEISFNYLGQLDQALSVSSPFRAAREPAGEGRSLRQLRRHLLDVSAHVAGGRLHTSIAYSTNLHAPATIERLARGFLRRLRGLVEHCRSERAGAFTPSDFLEAGLDAAALDRLMSQIGRDAERGRVGPRDRLIESVYALSPAQEGILFHGLYAPGSGTYCVQMSCRLEGDLDVGAFRGAWQRVIERHAILRSAFFWEGLPRPVQVAFQHMALPWADEDWSGLPSGAQDARLDALLGAERGRRFDPSRLPMMRLVLVRLGERRHRFVWTFHHVLLDGWSLALLLGEIFRLYGGLREGAVPRLEPVRPFREFIAWLGRQDGAASERYWRRTLGGWSEPTPLGLARALPGRRGMAVRRVALDGGELAALQQEARRHQLTLNTLVQAAWAILLGRHGGGREVVFGVTVAGRPAELQGAESMVGMFINTLPVRVGLARPGEPLASWLRGLQGAQAELRQHEHSALVAVQGWSAMQRGRPLFDSIVVFENYPRDPAHAAEGAALTVTDLRAVEHAHYPLTAVVVPGERLALNLEYDRARFEDAAAARLAGHFLTLLAGLAGRLRDGGGAFPPLPMLSAAERHQALVGWNDSELAPAAGLVHREIAALAARRPEAPAVLSLRGVLSYGELARHAGRLARRLRQRGAGPGTLVGLCLERSAELLVGLLGILEAGAAYVPLDPSHPAERLAAVLAATALPLVVTRAELAAALPACDADFVLLDRVDGEAEAESARGGISGEEGGEERAADPPAGAPAYVIHTSGSTGRPKGVPVSHGALARYVAARLALYREPVERFLLLPPISFDASVAAIFWTLCRGGALVVPHDSEALDPERLAALAGTHRVSHWLSVPALWAAVLEVAAPAALASLRTIVVAGEACPPELVVRTRERLPAALLANEYGPTEATIWSTVWFASGAGEPSAGTVPIGRPIPGVRAYLLDAGGETVPPGVAAELHVGGNLAQGYWGRPDLTADRFVPDPFAALAGRPGERLYRTGDLARHRPDGQLEYLGRIDRQVKVRGWRIEPAEIEAALAGCRGVREAAVVLREDLPAGRGLVAFVAAEGPPPTSGALRDHLAGRLPEPMVPAAFVVLPALPRSHEGKVDHHALQREALLPERAASSPRTPVAEVLAGIFADVLGCERVGGEEDFFALGGHSLLATRVVSRVREALGVELPLPALFEAPTATALAPVVAGLLSGEEASAPLAAVPRPAELPLSFAQHRLWRFDQLSPGGTAYHMSTAVRLGGRLDLAALRHALGEVVRRHESLRTTFCAREGRAVQVIAPPGSAPPELPLVDLGGLAEAVREVEAGRTVEQAVWRPFDLARGPLWRAGIVRAAAGEHVVWVTMHHIVSDGWSMTVLTGELCVLYTAFATGAPPLPALPLQYADFALWQRQRLRGENLERLAAFWRQELAGTPPALDLPTDRARLRTAAFRGAGEAFTVDPAVGKGVVRLSREQGATTFMTLLAAFEVVLWRYTGQHDFLVGSVVAGRDRRETEGLIGFFVNDVLLRADLAGAPTFRKLLARVRGGALRAYAHQEVPLDLLADRLRLGGPADAAPLSQIRFILDVQPPPPPAPAGLVLTPFAITGTAPAKTDLTLYMEQAGSALAGTFVYNADLLHAPTVRRLAERFLAVLADAVADPERPIAELGRERAAPEQVPAGFAEDLQDEVSPPFRVEVP